MVVLVALVYGTTALAAQDEATPASGSTLARVGGGLLGFYSTSLLGSIGAMIPCNQTYIGVRCVQLAGVTTGVAGLVSGFSLGAADSDKVGSAAIGSVIGFAAGSIAGLVIKSQAPLFGWPDVATLGFVGGAWGASWLGATVGLAAGSAVGVLLWQAIPSFDLPNAAGVGLMGMALGGVGSWIAGAIDAHRDDGGAPITLTLPLAVRF